MAKISILIVEDVDDMREFLGHLVGEMEGLRVSGLARHGWDARQELTRRRPDLILLDEILPGESSYDLLQEFHGAGIPVILLTGMESPSHDIPATALGRLIKPGWKSHAQDGEALRKKILELFAQATKS